MTAPRLSDGSKARRSSVLLVGASGRVGRMVLRHWKAADDPRVKVFAQHRDRNRADGLFWSMEHGVLPPCDHPIDAIISLAGVTPDRSADLSQNTALAQVVLQAAHRARIPRVLLASSSAVYGVRHAPAFQEHEAPAPVNAYGAAKQAMEAACDPWRDKGLEVCCLRIGNVAGADALLQNVARSKNGVPITIDQFADRAGPTRSYIGPQTLAHVLKALACQREALPVAMNVAAPNPVFMEDLVRATDHPYRFRPAPNSAFQRITLDCARLAAFYPFPALASDPAWMVAQWRKGLPQ